MEEAKNILIWLNSLKLKLIKDGGAYIFLKQFNN